MKKIIDLISEEVMKAFGEAGYDSRFGTVTVSKRPDLCEYQCSGAMGGAKQYHKAPLVIAGEVVKILEGGDVVEGAAAVAPGFINCNVKKSFLCDYLRKMAADDKFGMEKPEKTKTILVDYGGPNVAKPLHVGHLRSAVIGESIKRICRYMGHNVIGDIHMGDWGLQMGLIIYELNLRKPELPYFDSSFTGEYPNDAPFTISELEEIYPTASRKSKEETDEGKAYKAKAMEATYELQNGNRGYNALWKHIINVSVTDMKRNYDNLNVHFDLWNGEASVQDRIPAMVQYLKDGGYAYLSNGALVVDVKEDTDTKEIPPCMILKSDGASLYNTTDLATIQDRMEKYDPDQIIYLTDKRQNLYFEQVFRCARKTKLVGENTELVHVGFGTVNGKDGKPYKTRQGGVPRLENLISEIDEEMLRKIKANNEEKETSTDEAEAESTSKTVGLAAIKYGDLSNQPAKDYIFDPDKFTSFEGDTGPYILYTIVRIKSIMAKYTAAGGDVAKAKIREAANDSEKALVMELVKFGGVVEEAYAECAPNRICAYIYSLSNACNSFYHDNRIMTETDKEKQNGWIALLNLTRCVLETSIDLLGFAAPERM